MVLGLALVIGAPALGANPGSYVIKELLRPPGENLWKNNAGYDDPSGKILRTTGIAIDPTKRTLVLISAGQSNSGNITPTAYVPTNVASIDNFSIYDGEFYEPSCPVLGTAWAMGSGPGHIGLRVADALVSAGKFDRVILVPVGAGSGAAANFAPGGVIDDRFRIAVRRLADRGITPASSGTTWAITWMQGESDTLAGTSQAGYVSNMSATIAQSYADGFAGRWFIARETWAGRFSSAVQAAQASLIDNVNVFFGGDIDSLVGPTYRQADNIHLNDAGGAAAARLIVDAMHASGPPF
ncbi:MAG TPA: sialate O-acetylesterase [Bradyrhizobium sp.]|jgi:hypothetical protein|nr:sialate O-acetylesterase [Bradyrhizobium sp.]